MELGDHGGVIGRALVFAWLDVNVAATAFRGQRGAAQNMINAQAVVALKTAGAVIPPAETFFRLIEPAEHIRHPQLRQPPEGRALRIAEEHMALPALRR